MKTVNKTLASSLSLALLLSASSVAMAQGEAQGQAPTGVQDQSPRDGYMATQTQPATPDMWDPQRVEQSLREMGFSDISDIREEGGQWRFTATRELTFDPQTGQVIGPDAQRAGHTGEAIGQAGRESGAAPAPGYMATQTQPATPDMWDPEAIEQQLAQKGFSDVSEIRREGAQWRFSARKDNQDLDLTFDPQSGEIRDKANQSMGTLAAAGGYMATQRQPAPPQMWDPERIEESLTHLGYSGVGEIRQEGGQWRLDAQKEGRNVTLIIDPQTGDVFLLQNVGSLEQPRPAEPTRGAQQPR